YGTFCVHSKSSIIPTVVLPTTEIIEPLFAGGENMHGRYEYVSLQTMEKAVDVILGIVSKS
uniref:hypothetical protein n=1 Tax=Streptococcus thermophilus TaxID=1308 RepID=UPI0026113CF2